MTNDTVEAVVTRADGTTDRYPVERRQVGEFLTEYRFGDTVVLSNGDRVDFADRMYDARVEDQE